MHINKMQKLVYNKINLYYYKINKLIITSKQNYDYVNYNETENI